MKKISVQECQELIDAKTHTVIDVRETWETDICCINGEKIPMAFVADISTKFNKSAAFILVCKTGKRAEAVANLLITDYGFQSISILEGGLTAWFAEKEPNFEMY